MSVSSASSTTKRRRLVLSCSECKRRKLKCDRQTPICARCLTMGHPELCKYDPRFFTGLDTIVGMDFTEDFSSMDFSGLLSSTGENGQSNVALPLDLDWESFERTSGEDTDHLAQATSQALERQVTVSSPSTHGRQTTTEPSQIFQGHFKGPSHWMSIVALFEGLSGFLQETIQGHSLLGGSRWATHQSTSASPRPVYSQDAVEEVMKRLLPAEQRCLDLLKSYFAHFAGLHGLFHVSSFWKEYKIYWDGRHDNSACFNATLLALMSCSRCLFMDEPLSLNASTARNEILQWLSAVESWLDGRKERKTSLEGFQIRCLVLFSKAINDIDSRDHYRDSQALLADAVSLGLHRDAKVLGITDCLERGLPSMASNLTSDIGPPENFKDCEYDRSTMVEPIKDPDNEFTNNSFARIAHSTRPLRLSMVDLVNNPRRHVSISQAQRGALHKQITQAIAEVPQWSSTTIESVDSSNQMICRASLELHLQELLLLLRLPFVCQKNPETVEDTDYLRFVCSRTSGTIIRIYEAVVYEGFSQMALPKDNLVRAGLCVCLLATCDSNQGVTSLALQSAPRMGLVESALQMAEQRVLTLGTGVQSLWILSAANSFVELGENSATSAIRKKRITDDITALITKMCMTQQNKEMGFGFSDNDLASHVLQIQRICDEVGLLSGGEMLLGGLHRPVEDQPVSPRSRY